MICLFRFILSARLSGGESQRDGLVHVYYNKTWGWVCGDQWDKRDADVACRMMDFDGSLSAYFETENDTETELPVWLNNVQCAGNESSLFACVHGGFGYHGCKGKRKAGVRCRSKGKITLAGYGIFSSATTFAYFYETPLYK